jgi:hypothetical protein
MYILYHLRMSMRFTIVNRYSMSYPPGLKVCMTLDFLIVRTDCHLRNNIIALMPQAATSMSGTEYGTSYNPGYALGPVQVERLPVRTFWKTPGRFDRRIKSWLPTTQELPFKLQLLLSLTILIIRARDPP